MPDQRCPSQTWSDQRCPDQRWPVQSTPSHKAFDQRAPSHVSPDQRWPFHSPPFQLVPFHEACDHRWPFHALPKMSCSPVRATPSMRTCTLPRAASSEPRPLLGTKRWTLVNSEVRFSARVPLMIPLPSLRPAGTWICCPLHVTSALIWSGVAVGNRWMRSATKPDVTAAACDVPEPRVKREPTSLVGKLVSTYEPGLRRLMTCVPGATTSTGRSTLPGFENEATTPSVGFSDPFASEAPTARMVGSYAGSDSEVDVGPSLPPAATTTIPCFHATSAA